MQHVGGYKEDRRAFVVGLHDRQQSLVVLLVVLPVKHGDTAASEPGQWAMAEEKADNAGGFSLQRGAIRQNALCGGNMPNHRPREGGPGHSWAVRKHRQRHPKAQKEQRMLGTHNLAAHMPQASYLKTVLGIGTAYHTPPHSPKDCTLELRLRGALFGCILGLELLSLPLCPIQRFARSLICTSKTEALPLALEKP